MYFEEYVNNLLAQKEKIDDVYLQRLMFAQNTISGRKLNFKRTVALPYLLNDLGVRRSKSPSLLAESMAAKVGVKIPSTEMLTKDLSACAIESFADLCDAVVLCTGDYDAVANAAMNRKEELVQGRDYISLVYSGTAIAEPLPQEAVYFFQFASECARNDMDAIIALHRAAATALKRLHNYSQTTGFIKQLMQHPVGTLAEELKKVALANNLYALLLIMDTSKRSHDYAKDMITLNAHLECSCIIDEGCKCSDTVKSEAARYRSQIAINYAQLLQNEGNYKGAVAFLERNLEQVQKDSPEYMPEALAAAGYACYMNRQFSDAVEHLQKAVDLFDGIGEIMGKKTATEILISSLEKSERNAEAQTVTAAYLTEFKGVTQ